MQRCPVIDENPSLSAWPQDASDLAQRSGDVRRVMKHAVARDPVEARHGERQALSVAVDDGDVEAGRGQMCASELDVARGEVDPGDACAGPRIPEKIDA